MTAGKRTSVPEEPLARYVRLVAAVSGAELKSNFGSAYTAVNGNMYSMISKHGAVGIRLPEPDRSEFMATHGAELFRADPAWPVAKEYVAVPEGMLDDTETLTPYLQRSLTYAQSLKPKSTARRASRAQR